MGAQVRIWLERVLCGITGVMGIVTIFYRSWIEALFGWDPDHGNGSVEWLIILGLLAVSAVFYSLSRAEVRRIRQARI